MLDVFRLVLIAFIIILGYTAVQIILGEFPETSAAVVIPISSPGERGEEPAWSATIELQPESVLAVNQPVSLFAEIQARSEDLLDEIHGAEVEIDNARILDETEDSIIFSEMNRQRRTVSASNQIEFIKPGEANLEYHISDQDDVELISGIGSINDYLSHKHNTYILLLSVATTILAVVSIFISI